jgi:hypothetical protein
MTEPPPEDLQELYDRWKELERRFDELQHEEWNAEDPDEAVSLSLALLHVRHERIVPESRYFNAPKRAGLARDHYGWH